MRLKFFAFSLGGVLLLAAARAEEPLNPPSPLVSVNQVIAAPGAVLQDLGGARGAQELGIPFLAASLYREVLATPAGAGGDRPQLILGLTTALLDAGEISAADEALQSYPGPRGSAWHLRAGLIAVRQKKYDAARSELANIKAEELVPADRGWRTFLQAALADVAADQKVRDSAGELYSEAEREAVSVPQRARFMLARQQVRIRSGTFTEAQLNSARAAMEAPTAQGRLPGYQAASTYIIELDAMGRKPEALSVLRQQLRALPAVERIQTDQFRLLLGLIAGAENGEGRAALDQLLQTGSDAEHQQIALEMLAGASTREPARADFRRRLDTMINAQPPSRILEDLYLVRAQLALSERSLEGYTQAENDANNLLQKFPGSLLKANALGVLTRAAWEQRRYRTAATYADQARKELPPGQTLAQLDVLIAEAWYRAKDFRSASEAYAAAIRERPEGIAMGGLMFQRVQAEIEGTRSDPNQETARLLAIQPMLDETERDPAFDVINRWRAEWNFARALLAANQPGAANARINGVLAATGADASALPRDLRLRMTWLQVWLSLEAGQPEQTLKLADALDAQLAGIAGPPDATRLEIASTTRLFEAQASFALSREEAAVQILQKLRKDFPKSDAAARSYIVEADFKARKDQLVEAQTLLTEMAQDPDFKDSLDAPIALYQAALLAERRGPAHFKEAHHLLETMVQQFPSSALVFDARFEEGDLERNLNEFPLAQQTYDFIVRDFPNDPRIFEAQLAQADCYNGQSSADPTLADRAAEIYERLLSLGAAPVDVRVEAGYKWGYMLSTRQDFDRAETTWWKEVVNPFLLDKPETNQFLGATGRRWMSRTLTQLGDLLEKQGRLEDAKTVWQMVLDAKLPLDSEARARLARFIPASAKL
jgi:TolA-binding protein